MNNQKFIMGFLVGALLVYIYCYHFWTYDYRLLIISNDIIEDMEKCDEYYEVSGFISPSEISGWAVYFTYGCRRNIAGHYQISVIDWDYGMFHTWHEVKYEDYTYFLNEAKLKRVSLYAFLKSEVIN